MNPDNENKLVPLDCDACPNRRVEGSNRTRGKWSAYFFALFLGVLVLFFSIERGPDGLYRRSADPPLQVWGMLLVMASCLGVQVDPEQVGQIIGKVVQK